MCSRTCEPGSRIGAPSRLPHTVHWPGLSGWRLRRGAGDPRQRREDHVDGHLTAGGGAGNEGYRSTVPGDAACACRSIGNHVPRGICRSTACERDDYTVALQQVIRQAYLTA
jgi:hypothetical protein